MGGGVKEVKTGKKAHLGFDQTEQRSIVYCSATMEVAQIAGTIRSRSMLNENSTCSTWTTT